MVKFYKAVIFATLLMMMMTTVAFAGIADIANISGQKNNGGGALSQEDNNPLTAIIDGNELTRWGSANASDNGDHVAVYIELEKEETIQSLEIAWYRGRERLHRIALEVSHDGGVTYEDVPLTTNESRPDQSLESVMHGLNYPNTGSYLDPYPLEEPTTGQFWKLKIFQREDAPNGVPTGTKISLFSMWEFYMNVEGTVAETRALEEAEAAAQEEADRLAREASAAAAKEEAANATEPPTNSNDSSSDDSNASNDKKDNSDLNIPLIAGIGGGVLLVVIIIVIIMLKKKKN